MDEIHFQAGVWAVVLIGAVVCAIVLPIDEWRKWRRAKLKARMEETFAAEIKTLSFRIDLLCRQAVECAKEGKTDDAQRLMDDALTLQKQRRLLKGELGNGCMHH